MQMNVDKLKKMAGAVRTGGKGSVRRCVLLLYLQPAYGILMVTCGCPLCLIHFSLCWASGVYV